jgi:hypothetical protein
MKTKFYWKLQFAKRLKSVEPIGDKKDLVLEYKVVDGVIVVLREYESYKRLDDFVTALFTRLADHSWRILQHPSVCHSMFK